MPTIRSTGIRMMDAGRLDAESVSSAWMPAWVIQSVICRIDALDFLSVPSNSASEDFDRASAQADQLIDQIESLGATAVLFEPLFQNQSDRFDTVDFFSIDRRLGDNNAFRNNLSHLHDRHKRVILSCDFRQTGREFFAFQDLRRNMRSSRFVDWYHVSWDSNNDYGDGFTYRTSHERSDLPLLNLNAPRARKYVLDVARMWLADYGVDGWYMVESDMFEPSFCWEFRQACKAASPDSVLIGDVSEGDYRKFVASDLLDTCTSSQVYAATIYAVNNSDLTPVQTSLERAFHADWGVYKDLSLVTYSAIEDVNELRATITNPRDLSPFYALLFTIPGIPCVDVGAFNLTSEIADLSKLRAELPALIAGTYHTLEASQTHFSFARQMEQDTVIVAVNIGNGTAALDLNLSMLGISDGSKFASMTVGSDQNYVVRHGRIDKLVLAPKSYAILAKFND